MAPPEFEGEGDQIRILGLYVDQLRRRPHMRLPWAAQHIIAFKRFLVRGQYSPDLVKAPESEPQLRELAEMIGIPTARLSIDQWAAVYKRILSSLLYRLDEFRRDGTVLGDRLDVGSNSIRWDWNAAQVRYILSDAYLGGDTSGAATAAHADVDDDVHVESDADADTDTDTDTDTNNIDTNISVDDEIFSNPAESYNDYHVDGVGKGEEGSGIIMDDDNYIEPPLLPSPSLSRVERTSSVVTVQSRARQHSQQEGKEEELVRGILQMRSSHPTKPLQQQQSRQELMRSRQPPSPGRRPLQPQGGSRRGGRHEPDRGRASEQQERRGGGDQLGHGRLVDQHAETPTTTRPESQLEVRRAAFLLTEPGDLGLAASRHAQPGMSLTSPKSSFSSKKKSTASPRLQPAVRSRRQSQPQSRAALSPSRSSQLSTFRAPMPPPPPLSAVTSLPRRATTAATSSAARLAEPPPLLGSSITQPPPEAPPEPGSLGYHLEGWGGLDAKASLSSQRRYQARASRACRLATSRHYLTFAPDSDRGRRLTFSTVSTDSTDDSSSSVILSPQQGQPLRTTTTTARPLMIVDGVGGPGSDWETAALEKERRSITSAAAPPAAAQQTYQLPPSPPPSKTQRTGRFTDVFTSSGIHNGARNTSPLSWKGTGLVDKGVRADVQAGAGHDTGGGGWQPSTHHPSQVPSQSYCSYFDLHTPAIPATVGFHRAATVAAAGTQFSQTTTKKLREELEGLLVDRPGFLDDEWDSRTVRDLIDTKAQEWRIALLGIRRATGGVGYEKQMGGSLGVCQRRRRELEHDLEGRFKGAYTFLLVQGNLLSL